MYFQVNTLEEFLLPPPTFFDTLKDIENLKRWTGLPSFEALRIIEENIRNIESIQKDLRRFKTTVECLICIVLIRLKKNLSFADISLLFGLNENLIGTYFQKFVPILKAALQPALVWPSKAQNAANMPRCFRPDFVNCRAICDCTEIEVQIPKTLGSQIKVYSNYKGK